MSSIRGTWWGFVVSIACIAGSAACDSERTGTAGSDLEMSDWDFGDDPLAIRLNVEGSSRVFACGAGFTAAQVEEDLVDAITEAESHCQGSQGNYVCDCDGTSKESYAFSCPAALFQACELDAEPVDGSGDVLPVVDECHALSREIEGDCTLEGERFACACEGGDVTEVTVDGDLSQASCDQALFNTCAVSCVDDFGACMPSERGTLGEYDCTCATNGFTHVARAESCEAALLWACNPLNQTDEVCTGYGGACLATAEGELSCTCADGTVHEDVALGEQAFRACRAALETTCGTGTPAEGAQCIAEANGYHARCTRGPSEDAAMTCECYEDGATRARVEQVDESSCDTALLETFCPELAD